MTTNITTQELQEMLGISGNPQCLQIWKDACTIYKTRIGELRENLDPTCQNEMIVDVIFPN